MAPTVSPGPLMAAARIAAVISKRRPLGSVSAEDRPHVSVDVFSTFPFTERSPRSLAIFNILRTTRRF